MRTYVKLSLCAPLKHLGEENGSANHSKSRLMMRRVVRRSLYSWGKVTPSQLIRKLVGGGGAEPVWTIPTRDVFPQPGTDTRLLGRPATA